MKGPQTHNAFLPQLLANKALNFFVYGYGSLQATAVLALSKILARPQLRSNPASVARRHGIISGPVVYAQQNPAVY